MAKGVVDGFKTEPGIQPGPTLPGTEEVNPKLGMGPVIAARDDRRALAVRMLLRTGTGSPVIELTISDRLQPPRIALTNFGAVESHLRPCPTGTCHTS